MNSLPIFLQPYFWNTDTSAIDQDRHAASIIARILALGDERALRWIHEAYSTAQIVAALKSSREIPRKTAQYWARFYDVPEQEVRCLQPGFQNIQDPSFQSVWALRSSS